MPVKKLITGQPKPDKTSQYNFDNFENSFIYENSIGIPPDFRNDKFTEKDLYTYVNGDEINETIIQYNLKMPGNPFVRIDNLVINNSGVKHKVGDINVRIYLFSRFGFTSKSNNIIPEEATYSTLNNVLNQSNSPFIIYNENYGNVGRGRGLGNIEVVEGVNIIENFSGNNPPNSGSLPGMNLNVSESLKKEVETVENQSVFNVNSSNPIYIAVYMKGNAKRGKSFWKFTDRRKKRIQIYKISNFELFTGDGDGITTQFQFSEPLISVTGGGGGGGREAAAFEVNSLNMTFNTLPGSQNSSDLPPNASAVLDEVNPSQPFYPSAINDNLFLTINPNRQLRNNDNSNIDQNDKFPDYFVKTKFSVLNLDNQLNNLDLQTYHVDIEDSLITSTPASIGFNLDFTSPTDLEDLITNPLDDNNPYGYFYFVIDWNDTTDKIKTIEDFLNIRPTNLIELKRKQDDNLFITNYKSFLNGNELPLQGVPLSNVYTTPGIKTVKIIAVSYNEVNREVGRWKLITSRFFLNINPNEYPDFKEINGANFTTIPYPFTTPVIGGVDENSKYKNSVKNIIESGKLGDTDIIDETFLLNDFYNDEFGQSITTHDLEQIRYFNKSFNMNDLLKINPMQDIGGGEFLGIVGIYSDGMFNYTLSGQFTDYNLMPSGYENMSYVLLELNINTYAAAAVFGGNGDPTEGDYQFLPQVGTAIDNEGREWKTYDVKTVIEREFRPFNYRTPLPDIVSEINKEPEYLATLPFPFYYEEFDGTQDGLFNTLDFVYWGNAANRPDIFHFLYKLLTGQNTTNSVDTNFNDFTYPEYALDYIQYVGTNIDDTSDPNLVANEVFPKFEDDVDISSFLNNPTLLETNRSAIYWDGELNKFPMESSVGQIFIGDNSDLNLRQNCKLELNTGELSGNSIYDSSGNSNKGILIGDYKIKKNREGNPMRRDSFIKLPKKTNNRRGAL